MSASLATVLVNAAWQIPLLAALAFALTRWPSLSASERHRIWGIALLLCFVTPLLTASGSLVPRRTRGLPTASAPLGPTARVAEPEVPPGGPTLTVAPGAVAALEFLYITFVVFGLLRLSRSFLRVVELRRDASGASLPHAIRNVEARCRRALGVQSGRLLVSSRVSSPITCGLLDPVIVVPTTLARNESIDLWTAVLGHELAHIRRRDYAWHVACEGLMLLVGLHPAARWIKKHVERTREEACDEIVAGELVRPRRYAGSLVQAAILFNHRSPGQSLGVLGAHSLEERIVALIDIETHGHRRKRATRFLASFAVVSLVLCGLALPSFTVAIALAAPPTEQEAVSEANKGSGESEPSGADDDSARKSYRQAGRRDPFLGPETRAAEGSERLWGFDVDTVSLHGIVKTPAGFTAMLVGPDERAYFVREGQRFYNGTLASIGEDAVVIRLEDTDPLSMLSRRDIELHLHQP